MTSFAQIYKDLDVMTVLVQKDPFALGPNYIHEGMSDCHRFIEKVAAYIRELGAVQFGLKKQIMLLKKAQKLQTDAEKLEQVKSELEEQQIELLEAGYVDQACRMKLQVLKASLTSLKFQWDIVSVSLGSNIADTEKKIPRRISHEDFLAPGDQSEEDELANLDLDTPQKEKVPDKSVEELLNDL